MKVDFDLDSTSKPKLVVGPDDLLLLLVQHWARDESVFPTEDDRHDLATIMLFNAYTGGRPAEFVHALKGKASQDSLGEADDTSKLERLPSVPGKIMMTRAMLAMVLKMMKINSLTTMTKMLAAVTILPMNRCTWTLAQIAVITRRKQIIL